MTNCRIVDFQAGETAITGIRHQVFTLEQGVDTAIDFDGLDSEAIHVLAYQDGIPIGTGRILDDGHIGRIAVLKKCRGCGVGAAILSTLIAAAGKNAQHHFFLYAQIDAVPFYRKLGFFPCGKNFTEAGIVHTPMEYSLKPF